MKNWWGVQHPHTTAYPLLPNFQPAQFGCFEKSTNYVAKAEKINKMQGPIWILPSRGIVTKQLTFQRGWENQPSYILTPINKTTTKFPWSSTTVLRWGLTTSRKSQFLPSVSTPRYHNNKVKYLKVWIEKKYLCKKKKN